MNELNKAEPEIITLSELGDLSKVKNQLNHGVKVDTLDSCQWSPLMKAAQNGHEDIVRLLILQGANLEQADKGNYTALLLAASRNHANIVEILIKNGAQLDHQEDTLGWSALIWATKLNHVKTVKTLLKNNANKNIKDFKGFTALDWAKQNKSEILIQLLK